MIDTNLLLDAVRIGLSACVANRRQAHPDGKRQRKARQRALRLRAARRMKHAPTYTQTPVRCLLGRPEVRA